MLAYYFSVETPSWCVCRQVFANILIEKVNSFLD